MKIVEVKQETRRTFLEDTARGVAGIGIVSALLSQSAMASQDAQKAVLASVRISENKDLDKIGGFVLVKDTPEGDLFVIRTGTDQYSALSNVCPHKQCLVEVKSSALIQCPCHHSAYKIDGTYMSGPAKSGLRKFPVRVDGDVIVVSRD